MKILLEISDKRASFFMEVLKKFSFVRKATPISDVKAGLLQDVKESIDEYKLVREGKLESRDAEDLIDEL